MQIGSGVIKIWAVESNNIAPFLGHRVLVVVSCRVLSQVIAGTSPTSAVCGTSAEFLSEIVKRSTDRQFVVYVDAHPVTECNVVTAPVARLLL